MDNAHANFHGCTVDVQAAMVFLTISTFPCYSLDHNTSCGVRNKHKKFPGCTVDVQAAMGFLIIST